MNSLYKTLNIKPISTAGLGGIPNYTMPTTVSAALPFKQDPYITTTITPVEPVNNIPVVSNIPSLTPEYDYEDITSGVGISSGVANAYAKNPRLGAFMEKASNLGNKMVSGALNTGRDIQSAYGNMDTFQKMNKVASSVKGLWDAYNGYKHNKMINRQLNFSMDMANKQYEANRKRINSQLEDRQARRHAEQPHAHQSVADYMKKYGV